MVNEIIQGNCLKIMQDIPDNSIDLILTDPPYGINYQSAWKDKGERFDKIEGDGQPFIWFLYNAFRVIRDGGSLVCFCHWNTQDDFAKAIKWAGFNLKSQVIWDRVVHGLGDLKAQFVPEHDVIWFATKGYFEFNNGRPKSVIRINRVEADKLVHPTEKPIKLMRHFIEILTQQGEVVLDPFCGSGSTCIASKQLKRQYIGIELMPEYVEISKNRLSLLPKRLDEVY